MIVINRAKQRQEFGGTEFHIKITLPGVNLNNSEDLGLAQLGRIDYSEIQEGFVVKMHPHKIDEIFSYIRKGKMMHEDSNGNIVEIRAKKMMLMNSGSGIFHEEIVPKSGEGVEMIQIFMRPSRDDLEPNVQFSELDKVNSVNNWRIVAGSTKSDAPLKINSEINIWDNHITEATELKVTENRIGLLYIFDGDVKIGKAFLHKGDSIVLNEDIAIDVASSPTADLVYFEMDESAKYSRSGAYSGLM